MSENKNDTLWDNQMINMARQNMPTEELEKYKKLGESMYADIDFPTSKVINNNEIDNNLPEHMVDAVIYLQEAIKSGLHPSMLSTDEKKFMNEIVGEKWYEDYGYTNEDLDDIVTVKFE